MIKDNTLSKLMKRIPALYRRWIAELSLTFWLLLALLAGVIGYWLGVWQLQQQVQALQIASSNASTALTSVTLSQQKLQQQFDFVSAELALEKKTHQLAQQDLKTTQDELAETKKQLAFLQQVTKPTQSVGGVVVESVSVQPGKTAGKFNYSLVLIQQNAKAKPTKLNYNLVLHGKVKGKKQQVDLLKLNKLAESKRRINLQKIQKINGSFALPKGFEVERMDVVIQIISGPQAGKRLVQNHGWRSSAVAGEILE
jgi:hypothetical protein